MPVQLRACARPGRMHETPCFNLPSGTLQPPTATDSFKEAFEGKTRGRTEPEQPVLTTSQSPKNALSKSNSHFTFDLEGLTFFELQESLGGKRLKVAWRVSLCLSENPPEGRVSLPAAL